jgi:molybdate transport system substrate-binding protein
MRGREDVMTRSLSRVAALLAALAFVAPAGRAGAAEIKVLSTIALGAAWRELQPKFEAAGHKLTLALGTSGGIDKRVAEGEPGDVIVSTSSGIETLARAGKITAGTSVPVARSQVGVAVPKGAPRPDISTPDALKQALLAAKAVAYSDPAGGGASGIHLARVLDRLGIGQQVNARARLGRAVPNAQAVVKGEADIAVQQIPELLTVPGVEVIGPLPGDLGNTTTFSAAVLATTRDPTAAKALVDFLRSPETVATLKAKGFEM